MTLDRSTSPPAVASIWIIVGVSANVCGENCLTTSHAASTENLSTSTRPRPSHKANPSQLKNPECPNGLKLISGLPGPTLDRKPSSLPGTAAIRPTCSTRCRCVNVIALGFPVVPEVKHTQAWSSRLLGAPLLPDGSGWDWGASACRSGEYVSRLACQGPPSKGRTSRANTVAHCSISRSCHAAAGGTWRPQHARHRPAFQVAKRATILKGSLPPYAPMTGERGEASMHLVTESTASPTCSYVQLVPSRVERNTASGSLRTRC